MHSKLCNHVQYFVQPSGAFLDFPKQVNFSLVNQFEDQFTEERVLPSEPGTCVVGGIVLVERLVDKARAGIGVDERLQALLYLAVVAGGEGPHHD